MNSKLRTQNSKPVNFPNFYNFFNFFNFLLTTNY